MDREQITIQMLDSKYEQMLQNERRKREIKTAPKFDSNLVRRRAWARNLIEQVRFPITCL